jgi:Protein of unknown function (DUF1566)
VNLEEHGLLADIVSNNVRAKRMTTTCVSGVRINPQRMQDGNPLTTRYLRPTPRRCLRRLAVYARRSALQGASKATISDFVLQVIRQPHMMRVSLTAAAFALAAMACMSTRVSMATDRAGDGSDKTPVGTDAAVSPDTHKPVRASAALPDIGTKMPDGTVYAGLSMITGKPSFVAAAGGNMPDGTIYAGISPDTNQRLYTTPADAPGVYTWSKAAEYCKALSVSGHQDWRMPTLGELAVQFSNRADIGGYNETGTMKGSSGYYWSSLQVGDGDAWGQLFSDGFHEDFSKEQDSSLRCVR